MVPRDSLLRSVCCRAGRSARFFDTHLATRSNTNLSVSNDTLAGLDSFFDHYQISLPLAQRYLSLFRGRVLLDDVNVGSFGRHLRRRGGYQHCSMNRAQDETNVDETSGPKAMSVVRNRGAQTDL